ncbi:MAG TPA: hypothetical protein PLO61_06545 [Fimbriimonadaceae bacterium]|nr:hypothetical protein [Fimbriimonadaceae bacterium]HRJ33248.1 hypothetical protein [Fimbriimonadaceae bacterium]
MTAIFCIYLGFSLLISGYWIPGLFFLVAPAVVFLQFFRVLYFRRQLKDRGDEGSKRGIVGVVFAIIAAAGMVLPVGVSFSGQMDWDQYLTSTVRLLAFFLSALAALSAGLIRADTRKMSNDSR